jgi:hypothetical protein
MKWNHDTFFIQHSHSTEGKARLKAHNKQYWDFLLPFGGGRTGCDCVKTENVHFGALRTLSLSVLILSRTICVNQKGFVPDNIKIMA